MTEKLTDVFERQMLTAVSLVAPLSTAVVKLFKAISTPITGKATVANFTECDYTDYASQPLAPFGEAYTNESGRSFIRGAVFEGVLGAAGSGNTILGYYVTDVAGTGLLFAQQWDNPIELAIPGQGFDFVPRIPLDT